MSARILLPPAAPVSGVAGPPGRVASWWRTASPAVFSGAEPLFAGRTQMEAAARNPSENAGILAGVAGLESASLISHRFAQHA